MSPRIVSAAACGLVVWLAGCEAPPAVVTAAEIEPIVNGQVEEGFPSTVAMGAEFGDNVMSMCTGNLITPEIVLCAGHCGEQIPVELIVKLGSAFFGTEITDYDERMGFSDFRLHPEYVPLESTPGGTLGQYDMSVFVLAEPVEIEPTWFNRRELTLEDDKWREMVSVGFGTTGADGAGSGTKRSADLVLGFLDEMFLYTYSADNPGEANICSGDSGGPQFFPHDNGRFVQAGVHSWGDQDCVQVGGSTRTDVAVDWLLEQIEDVHGTDDVCEINGWYDDGICDDYCDEPDPDCEPAGDDDTGDDDTAGDDDAAGDDDDGGEACACSAAGAPAASTVLSLLVPLAALLRRRL